MRKLFGTDGIRGVAGIAPLDNATVFAVGAALASALKQVHPVPRVVLGMDTRESGPGIAGILYAGLSAGGATLANAGIITTPAIAYLTRKFGFSAGIVVSASHNPWQDNGIKIFGFDGYKLPDALELASIASTGQTTRRFCWLRFPASRSTACESCLTAPTGPLLQLPLSCLPRLAAQSS
jgi:phosphoglucosamine mutase